MISIKTIDLDNLEQIGSGKYGIVYQASDTIAYKVYKDTVLGFRGHPESNPALYRSFLFFMKVKNRREKIKNTELFRDIIYIDGNFGGVVIPYYQGCTLNTFQYCSYDLKKDIARQLIRNNRELNSNCIYPSDYKLGNIMVVDNQARIIDLDDPLTYYTMLPNPILKELSERRINETIQDFFGEYDFSAYNHRVTQDLERKRYLSGKCKDKDWLEKFFAEKESNQDYLIIDENSDVETIKELLRNHQYHVIYLLAEQVRDIELLRSIIDFYKRNGIKIFDFTTTEKQDKYFGNFPVKEKVLVKRDPIHIK